jgi:hypothetical protein
MELTLALRKANNRSALGHDGVSSSIVKIACEDLEFQKLLLTAINNQVMVIGRYPKEFKSAKIIALPKRRKGEYRPNSLLPSISKLLDYIMQIRIREIVESQLPEHQFGCRPGHSRTQALMKFAHHAGVSAGTNNQFGAVFNDFTKAYDGVPRHILIKKLSQLQVPAYLTLMVYDWLRKRKFQVAHRGQLSETREQQNGIPQGSSLSVLLWLVFVYNIPLKHECSNIYVDDTVGWAIAKQSHKYGSS